MYVRFYGRLSGNGLNPIPSFRRFHDPTHRQRPFFLQVLSHGYIGGHHEAFNDVLSDVVLVSCVAAWIAGIVISIASLLS